MILTTTALAAACLLASYIGVAGVVAQRFTQAQRKAPLPLQPGAAQAVLDVRDVRFAARDGLAQIAAAYLPVAQPGQSRGAVVFVHGKDACRGDELKGNTAALAYGRAGTRGALFAVLGVVALIMYLFE